MKKIALILILAALPLSLFAAPFGLQMGMTIDEIAEQCEEEPEFVKDDIYMVKPIKRHPLFSYYAVYVNERAGLYQIRAVSDYVACNKYGTEIQNAFNSVKDRITKTYGKPRIINRVDSAISSFLQKDEYWFQTLKDGSRQLSAILGERSELTDGLVSVKLDCATTNDVLHYDAAHLVLYYYFENADFVEDEQDEVF